jgi:hypothetical protein
MALLLNVEEHHGHQRLSPDAADYGTRGTKSKDLCPGEDYTLLLNDDVFESLFQLGVSCEFLEVSLETEEEAWSKQRRGATIDPMLHCAMVRWMRSVATELQLQSAAWYAMATLLDLYLNTAGDRPNDSLPAVCATIVGIVQKLECSDDVSDCPLQRLPELSKWLQSQGLLDSPPTVPQDVRFEELEVLQALEWRVIVPTVFTWSSAFMVRFTTLTRQMFTASLAWIWEHNLGQMAFFLQGNVTELQPRQLAIGLFALGLVSANIIPVNMVFPEEADADRRVFLRQQQEGAAKLCDPPEDWQQLIRKVLEFSTKASQSDIQQYCREVTDALAIFQQHPSRSFAAV